MAEQQIEVKTSDECDDLSTISSTGCSINCCQICLQVIAKYTCPRCNVGYCSIPCYQSEKHSACSEAFYKDCVINELKDMHTVSQDREKVIKMLCEDLEQRAVEESDEDQEEEDLADRLNGLDIDKDYHLVWSRLTQKEKEDFARMLQDGRLAKLIEIWTPWWRCKENCRLVKEKQEKVTHLGGGDRNMPHILGDIPEINTLMKNSQPSSDCRFDLVNILFSYCFVSRIHNGSCMECPVDSTQDVFEACTVLRDQYRCGNTGEAIQKALDDVCRTAKGSEASSHKFNLTVLEDVKIIICGPGQSNSLTFMSAALSDLILLLRTALVIVKKECKSLIQSESKDLAELKSLRSRIFKSEKKLIFLLSWLQHYWSTVHQLVPFLQFEIETRQSEAEEVEDIKALVEKNMDKLKPSNIPQEEGPNEECFHKKIIELN